MDFARMLREKRFYLAVLLAFSGIVLGTAMPELKEGRALETGTFLKLTTEGLKSQTALFLLPVAAVLPCAEEYLRERQCNFLRFLIVRRSKTEYCRDRVLTTSISGALGWVLAAMLATLGVCLIASALADFAAFLGTVSGSSYLALGLPFIVFYAGIILRQRYLEELYCVDPSEWILAENNWGPEHYALWIFLILLALCMAALHRMALDKKLEEI